MLSLLSVQSQLCCKLVQPLLGQFRGSQTCCLAHVRLLGSRPGLRWLSGAGSDACAGQHRYVHTRWHTGLGLGKGGGREAWRRGGGILGWGVWNRGLGLGEEWAGRRPLPGT